MTTDNSTIPLSQDELYTRLVSYVSNSYGELDNYNVELSEDVLSTGVHRVQKKITQARGWANRVLAMLREVKRWQNKSTSLSEGKKDLFERRVATFIRDTTWPKGVGADERKAQAQLQYEAEQEDARKWHDLTSELRSLSEACDKKHKDLVNSKDDLKALLWSARLQFVLDSGNINSTEIGRQAQMAQLAKPVFEPDDNRDDLSKINPSGNTVDELLKGG